MQRLAAAGVGVLLIAAAVVGAVAVFDGKDNKGLVTPVGQTEDGACQDIDAPQNPEACNFDPDAPQGGGLHRQLTEVWLVDGDPPVLSQATRQTLVPSFEGVDSQVTAVLEGLLKGLNGADIAEGAETEIPEGTQLLDVTVEDGVAAVDLSKEFDRPTTTRSDSLRNGQVVFTATQIEGVEQVQLFVEGMVITAPTGRDSYPQTSPPIVVEQPRIGSEHRSPLEITGTANVFEATVSIRLETPEYNVSAIATASCGSGCRGEFSKILEFDVSEATEATLVLYQESAEDGSALHEVRIPLTLLPGD